MGKRVLFLALLALATGSDHHRVPQTAKHARLWRLRTKVSYKMALRSSTSRRRTERRRWSKGKRLTCIIFSQPRASGRIRVAARSTRIPRRVA